MTASPLSTGPVMGVLTANGTSPIFSTTAGTKIANVMVFLSPLAIASAVVTLRVSTDGGNTWTAFTATEWTYNNWQNGGAARVTSAMFPTTPTFDNNSCVSFDLRDTASCLYQLSITLNAGSAFYSASQGFASPTLPHIVEPGTAVSSPASDMTHITISQLSQLYQSLALPLAGLGVLTSPMTLYQPNRITGNLVTLSAPAGATVSLWTGLFPYSRLVSASSAAVTAIVDANNNAIASASNAGDTFVTNPPATFQVGTSYSSVIGFTTMLEAACFSIIAPMDSGGMNLAALGL